MAPETSNLAEGDTLLVNVSRSSHSTVAPRSQPSRAQVKKRFDFAVQKPAARELHFNFQLELNGVVKSWAIPNGPSPDPSEKRLAVHMDDQPIGDPKPSPVTPRNGEQNVGAMQIWDKGTWEPLEDPSQAYADGHIRFILHGAKMRGTWELVRIAHKKPGRHNGKENWLLVKTAK